MYSPFDCSFRQTVNYGNLSDAVTTGISQESINAN